MDHVEKHEAWDAISEKNAVIAQKDAIIIELVRALELMTKTYPYTPPCLNWEPQVEAHSAAKSALTKAKGGS